MLIISSCATTRQEEYTNEALRQGAVYLESGRFADAATVYRDAIAKYPSDERLLYNLSIAYALDGLYAESLDVLDTLLELSKNNVTYVKAKAGLLLSMQDERGAIDTLSFLVSLDPYDEASRLQLARLLHQQGRYEEALSHAMALYEQKQFSHDLFLFLADIDEQHSSSWRLLAEEYPDT